MAHFVSRFHVSRPKQTHISNCYALSLIITETYPITMSDLVFEAKI